jgi:hypothetical protein
MVAFSATKRKTGCIWYGWWEGGSGGVLGGNGRSARARLEVLRVESVGAANSVRSFDGRRLQSISREPLAVDCARGPSRVAWLSVCRYDMTMPGL